MKPVRDVCFFRKINPADCVDMDCDGMKKNLLDDLDGTLLGGSRGSVISESEWEWDGDPRRGLGDYRIPKTLLTDTDGKRIPVEEIAPHKGMCRERIPVEEVAPHKGMCRKRIPVEEVAPHKGMCRKRIPVEEVAPHKGMCRKRIPVEEVAPHKGMCRKLSWKL